MSIGLATFGDCDPCCGGDECLICSDDFDRADSSDVSTGSDCGWTETAGNPTIESNALKFTGASAILLCNEDHPDGFSSTKITCNVKASTGANLARIIVAYDDSSNYYFAEWKAGTSGYLRIYRRASGVDTQLATTTFTTPLDTYFTFSACVTNAGIKAELGGTIIIGIDSGIPDRPLFGLGTGGTLSGSVHFDDFSAEKVSAECEQCYTLACTACSPQSSTPEQFGLVISGMGTPGGLQPCENCADFNGSYILNQASACAWIYDLSPAICDFERLRIVVATSGGNLNYTLFFDTLFGPGLNMNVTGSLTGRDCNRVATVSTSSGQVCSAVGATFTLTPILAP